MYAELNCKSNFSFLRGASDSRELVERAIELGLPAIGITDINGVYALPRAYEAVKRAESNIKLIVGAEVTLGGDHPPIQLIAQNRRAYGLLCRILTQVHMGKEKGEGFIEFSELQYLFENHAGRESLVCLPRLHEKTQWALLSEMFQGNIYLPLCRYLDGLDSRRTEQAREIAEKYSIPIVASNDVHYHLPERRPLQDCLTCIREGVTIPTAGFHLFGNEERYLKSDLQMRALFHDMPDAIQRTLEIADKCSFHFSELKYTYPQEFIPAEHTSQSYLEELTFQGAHATYGGIISPRVDQQIRHELQLIKKLNYADYFLTIQDIVQHARSEDIICQGRGSAANSIVCYVLGITSVDPIHMNLLFERFISEERSEPPDIDVDFEHQRREEVIQYIYKRYGFERAGMVSAVRTYQKRSAFLELSKAVGIDVGTISAKALEQNFAEYAQELQSKKPVIDRMVSELVDFPRHLSIHSGGFVLSHEPLIEIVPIEPARMPGRTIVQWDKHDLETLGLMKVDVLSLGFLTAMHKASKLADLDWRTIPANDEPTYEMIRRAETEGTFQIESRAQKAMMVRTLPENFYDLVVQVAIVRPGPSVGQMIPPYIQGRINARKGIAYTMGDPEMDEILARTYGVPVFQEQLMKVAIVKAGYTPGEADQLRRAVNGWRSAQGLDDVAQKLYDRLLACGVSQSFADQFFNYMKGYAHYGFPESHAISFASIAYKSAYFKCHHPAELLCGLVNSQPMGFYSIDTLINEAKRGGVKVLPIHPNKSTWDMLLEEPKTKTVRMGFRNLRHTNEEDVKYMLELRQEKEFTTIEDFIYRNRFTRPALESMAIAGVFTCFGLDRRHSFWQSIEFSRICQDVQDQLSLFNEKNAFQARQKVFAPMTLLEETVVDYRRTGYSLHGNMMRALRLEYPHLPSLTSRQAKKLAAGRWILYAGTVIVNQRPPTAKGTAFLTFEDEDGTLDTIVKNDIYEKHKWTIENSRFLMIEGKVQRQGQGMYILISKISSFTQKRSERPMGNHPSPRSFGRLNWRGT